MAVDELGQVKGSGVGGIRVKYSGISCCGKLTNRLQNILKDFLWEALEKYGEGIEASFSCLTVVTMMAEITNTDKSLDRGMLEI
ncbi:unnamed protein product [Enterobius vermicularis]|uniref:PFK domain-containing protein n=1 Tax=Enterobius vermicularis TaxID=51028 RepID=A0A0N4VC89_ENTVE|nr:unnamed protein product [Enterobius vermicularis]